MSVTIYHNPRCSKSRQTLAILEEKNVQFDIVEYLSDTPSAKELSDILAKLGMSAADIVRKKEAKEAGIDVGNLSEGDLVAALVANPIAIERPIVVSGKRAVMGRPPENVLDII